MQRYLAGGTLEGGSEEDTVLDFLYCVCDILVDRYHWDDYAEDVPLFVLSGRPPRLLFGTLTFDPPKDSNDLRNGLIAIYVSARMSPRELMKHYSDYRSDLLNPDDLDSPDDTSVSSTRVRGLSRRCHCPGDLHRQSQRRPLMGAGHEGLEPQARWPPLRPYAPVRPRLSQELSARDGQGSRMAGSA